MICGRRSFFGYLVHEDGEVYCFANITRPDVNRRAVRSISAQQWSRGRVVAIGDAVHATSPAHAQGAGTLLSLPVAFGAVTRP